MSKTSIEWTDTTWNPVRGCSMAKGSENGGCLHCYAAAIAARNLPGMRSPTTGDAFAVNKSSGPRWTGKMEFIPEKLSEPLSWRKPRRCFVNSMSDLFHESLPFENIAAVFGVMAATPHITYQVLTKRPEQAVAFYQWLEKMAERLISVFPDDPLSWRRAHLLSAAVIRQGVPGEKRLHTSTLEARGWPLPNVQFGTSVENQKTFDLRWPHLRACPAAVRFISYEPALGPVDFCFHGVLKRTKPDGFDAMSAQRQEEVIDQAARAEYMARCETPDWVICGGESGHGARPMHPDWARSTRDQCATAGVPFFFKQWGEYGSRSVYLSGEPAMPRMFPDYLTWTHKGDTWINSGFCVDTQGRVLKIGRDMMLARDEGTFPVAVMHRMGKAAAGRLLDGRTYDEFPEAGR